jgi:hypothetical protein
MIVGAIDFSTFVAVLSVVTGLVTFIAGAYVFRGAARITSESQRLLGMLKPIAAELQQDPAPRHRSTHANETLVRLGSKPLAVFVRRREVSEYVIELARLAKGYEGS